MSECLLTFRDGIFELELNRPAAMNALSQALLDELAAHLQRVKSAAEARVLVVKSATNKAFCAGADLKERRAMDEAQVQAAVGKIRATIALLASLPIPTIAAVRGVALGGGFELALACDLRVAANTAAFGLPETRLAIIPGAGGTQRLARLVGAARAKDMIFTGRRVTGEEAYQLGIVEYLANDLEVHSQAQQLANAIADGGPVAVRQAKWAIDEGLHMPLHEALALEASAYDAVIHTEDRLEGLAAFAEKRKPNYQGR